MGARWLIVEDEAIVLETLACNLRRQGYEVHTAVGGPAALEKARSLHPAPIFLGVMLSKMDGFEVCRVPRQEMVALVLMLTARTERSITSSGGTPWAAMRCGEKGYLG